MAADAKKSEVVDGFTIKYHANGTTRCSEGRVKDGEPVAHREWFRVDGTLTRSGHSGRFDAGERLYLNLRASAARPR